MAEEQNNTEPTKKSLDNKWKLLRDVILFFGGLLGVANEAVLQDVTDPTLLILFGAMMGLPAFLRKDEDK